MKFFYQLLLCLISTQPFLFAYAQSPISVWNEKYKPYQERIKEFNIVSLKLKQKRNDDSKKARSESYLQKKELEDQEKNERAQIDQQYQEANLDRPGAYLELRIEYEQKKLAIKNKYARKKLDIEKEIILKDHERWNEHYEQWLGQYHKLAIHDHPLPNPEIEALIKPVRESEERFIKSKVRIYKKAVIDKRNAINKPIQKKALIENSLRRKILSLDFSYKYRDFFDNFSQKSLALEHKIFENDLKRKKDPELLAMFQALGEESIALQNQMKLQEREVLANDEKESLIRGDQQLKDLQDKIVATLPLYVQEALVQEGRSIRIKKQNHNRQ